MGAKILIALLLIALVLMTFKFMREREARLRERAGRAERRARGRKTDRVMRDAEEVRTVTLRKDPETGAWVPDEKD